MQWLEVTFQIGAGVSQLIQGIAWPAVVLIVALIFVDDIRKLLPRLKKAGLGGVEMQEAASTAISGFLVTGELKKFQSLRRTPLLESIEKTIHRALETVKNEDQVDLLVWELASTRMQRSAESAFSEIFGSQMMFLRQLQSLGGTMPLAEAESYYSSVRNSQPALTDWDFLKWFNYLRHTYLATIAGDKVEVTEFTADFIEYVGAVKTNIGRLN